MGRRLHEPQGHPVVALSVWDPTTDSAGRATTECRVVNGSIKGGAGGATGAMIGRSDRGKDGKRVDGVHGRRGKSGRDGVWGEEEIGGGGEAGRKGAKMSMAPSGYGKTKTRTRNPCI